MAQQEHQLIARVLDGRLRIEQLKLSLRHELLRAQHIQLRDEAGVELRFRSIAQLARAIQALLRDLDEGLLRDDAVIRGRDVDGHLLFGERSLADRRRPGAAPRRSANGDTALPKPRSSGCVIVS